MWSSVFNDFVNIQCSITTEGRSCALHLSVHGSVRFYCWHNSSGMDIIQRANFIWSCHIAMLIWTYLLKLWNLEPTIFCLIYHTTILIWHTNSYHLGRSIETILNAINYVIDEIVMNWKTKKCLPMTLSHIKMHSAGKQWF